MVLVDAEHPSNSLTITRMVDNIIDVNQETPITEHIVKTEISSMKRQEDIGKRAEKMAVKILGNMITNLRLLPSFRTIFNELMKYLKDAKYLDIHVSNFSKCMYIYTFMNIYLSIYNYFILIG